VSDEREQPITDEERLAALRSAYPLVVLSELPPLWREAPVASCVLDALVLARRKSVALGASLAVFDHPDSVFVRELLDGEWTHSLAELPGDKAVAHVVRLLRRVVGGER
jgi:hypothetical protein